MGLAKNIIIRPISSGDANLICKKFHYSKKVVPNSQLHFGVFLNSSCEGVLQFGPSMNKKATINLVNNTGWNNFLELNRMAFSDLLPKNSESRAISICLKLIRKHYPNIDWVISYADATQCGDGTIYRASGFLLTGIKKNTTILKLHTGEIVADKTLNNINYKIKGQGAGYFKRLGAKPLCGYQLRYIYFLNKEKIKDLNATIIPYSKIAEMGIRMYKGLSARKA